MNYFLRKYSRTDKRNPAIEMVVVIAATNPSNSLYVFKYATIKPIEITLKKISKESIFSNFFLHFPSDHSSRCFNQNISPASDSNNSNDCINIHYIFPLLMLVLFLEVVKQNQLNNGAGFHPQTYSLLSQSQEKITPMPIR